MNAYRSAIFFLSASAIFGCAPADYVPRGEIVQAACSDYTRLEEKRIDSLKEIEFKKIAAEKDVKLKELELQLSEQKENMEIVSVSVDHCLPDKDEDPERYVTCLELALGRGAGSDIDHGSVAAVPAISGDNNVVTIGSPGAEINYGADQEKRSPIQNAIISGMNKPFVVPEMPQQVNQYGPLIDGAKSLGKAAMYTVLGYKAAGELGGMLSVGMGRDSIGGDYVTRSYNPVTKTTMTGVAE